MTSPIKDINDILDSHKHEIPRPKYILFKNFLTSFDNVQGINTQVILVMLGLSQVFDVDPDNELFDTTDVSQQCIDMFYYIMINRFGISLNT